MVPRYLLVITILLGSLFGPAGRLDLPYFWVWAAVLIGATLVGALVFDRELLSERLRPGPSGEDRHLRFAMLPFLLGHLVLAGLDVGRFQWSTRIPVRIQTFALAGLVLSMSLTVWAAKINRFFSPVVRIQSERGHHLVKAGPYRWIRHPGYAAAFGAIICSGPALGSWWSMAPLAVPLVLILRRTIIEDRFLHQHLDGYRDYAAHVRYRYFPWIW